MFFARCSCEPTSDIDKEKHFKWVYLWVQMFMLLLISSFSFQAMLISLLEANSLFSQPWPQSDQFPWVLMLVTSLSSFTEVESMTNRKRVI